LAVNTARHLSNGAAAPALPDDMREAAKLTGAMLNVGPLEKPVTPAKAGVQFVDFTGFRPSPE
jgi:hypothetical protein